MIGKHTILTFKPGSSTTHAHSTTSAPALSVVKIRTK